MNVEAEQEVVIFWSALIEDASMWTAENRSQYAGKGLRYPSDVTDAEWDLVRPVLTSSKHKGSPSPERVRAILNGVLSVLSTGCQWRALPKDLPARSTVHGWFVRWHCDGVLDRLHFALYQQARELAGKDASPTAAIVDSQSVKSLEKGAGRSIRSAMTRARRSRARSDTSSSTRWA
jgi:transposase